MKNLVPLLAIMLLIGCKNLNKQTDKIEEKEPVTVQMPEVEIEQNPQELIGNWIFVLNKSDSITSASLKFMNEVKLIGNDGCNQFFGHYKAIGSSLKFQAMSATKKICPEVADIKIIPGLGEITNFRIENDQLTLLGKDSVSFTLIKESNE